MSTDPIQLLRSSSPKDRANGIKLVARMRNDRALRVLLKVAQEDEDPQVRDFAKKGAAYVVKKLEEAGQLDEIADKPIDSIVENEPEPEPEPEEEVIFPEGEVEVSERNQERAKSYVGAAFDQNMIGQKEKAIQSLSKALKINPNLRFDGYFNSVATSVTGLSSEEALVTLYSEKKRKGAIQQEKDKKVSASAAEHMAEAEKHTWGSLTVDLGILAAVAFLGMLFAVLMLPFGINSQVNSVESQIAQAIENAGGESELSGEAQANIAEARDNIELLREVNGYLGFPLAAILGVAAMVGIVLGLIAFGATGHAVARALGGEGTMPYMIHNVVGAYTIPLLVIYILMMLLPVLIFIISIPPRFALIGVSFILAIVVLVISFRVNSRIRRAYFGINMIKSSVIYFVAGIPYSIVIFAVGFAASIVVTSMLSPIFELIPIEEITGGQPPA